MLRLFAANCQLHVNLAKMECIHSNGSPRMEFRNCAFLCKAGMP